MALIADPRNDENLIVAQTHLAMIHFHNRVLDKQPASVPDTQKFTRARKRVSLHYQWMVRHDYLPRICSAAVLNDVFTNGRKLVEPNARPTPCRRCRSSSRWPPSGSATAWSGRPTTGTASSRATAGCWSTCSSSRAWAATLAARSG